MQGGGPEGRTWAIFMIAGGHFAGAIVRVSTPDQPEEVDGAKKKGLRRPKTDTEVLRHKTFHRYTSMCTFPFRYLGHNSIFLSS